jgi:hypothetical protein
MAHVTHHVVQAGNDRDDTSGIVTEAEVVDGLERATGDALLAYRRHHEIDGTRYWTLDVARDLLGLIEQEEERPP